MGKVSSFKESGEQIEKKKYTKQLRQKKNSNNADNGTEPTYHILSYDPLDQPVRPARHIARPSCYVLRTCLQKNRSNNSHTNTHKHTHTKQTHIAHIQLAGRYTIEKLISNPSVQYSSPLVFSLIHLFIPPPSLLLFLIPSPLNQTKHHGFVFA